MVFDTSYSDKEITRKINAAVGPSFSFKERWRMGGIGSPRMVIDAISEEYERYLNPAHYQSHANLELRPQGILIHFRHKLQAYTWVMPYRDLQIDWNNSLTLTCQGKYIRFKPPIKGAFVERIQNHLKDNL